MQSISERTTHAAVVVQNFVNDAVERLRRDEEGQAAVEYAGILALLALVFAAIFALKLDDVISKAINSAIETITKPGD
jgi:Flp pilus assembly pilin Flp